MIKPVKQFLGNGMKPGDSVLAEDAIVAIEGCLGPQPTAVRDDILAGVLLVYLANRGSEVDPFIPRHVPLAKTREDLNKFIKQVEALELAARGLWQNAAVGIPLQNEGLEFAKLFQVLNGAAEAAEYILRCVPTEGGWTEKHSAERTLICGIAAHYRSITKKDPLKGCTNRGDEYYGPFFDLVKAIYTELDVLASTNDSTLGRNIHRALKPQTDQA